MRSFLIYILLLVSTLAYSIPAKRIKKTITVDGESIEITLVGNENLHFWRSADGRMFQQKDDGKFARFQEETYKMALSRQRFQPKKEANLNPSSASLVKARNMRKSAYTGKRRGLLILVNFADKKFSWTTNPLEDYKKIASAENYKESRNFGSVRDYFKAQSYGKFDFVLDVVGPVTVSRGFSYYGKNDVYGNDLYPATMIWEACKAVDDEVDFSQYDWDGDGVVEQVFVLYAGYGEAQGGKAATVWPHSSSLKASMAYEPEITSCVFDGVTVDTYACSCELSGGSGTTPDGIGTICHEFSHCFGLPDFYCSDYSHDDLTMSEWSILDYGSYSDGGYTPVSYTAYERWFCGWLEPTELSSPRNVKGMTDINENGDAYIIYNDANKNEYYIMQNVQQEGWNSHSPGHGLLVLHVDYDKYSWDYNIPNNNAKHLRMTPICADNRRSEYNLSGDTYPGTSGNTQLTDESYPAATLYNKNTDGKLLMHKPITDIAESDEGVVSFRFMGGINLDIPADFSATMAGKDIKASWDNTQEYATSYNIKYGSYEKDNVLEGLLVDEDFSKTKAATDSNADISGSLDQYLNMAGFTGSHLYKGVGGLKFGTSTTHGDLVSPILTSSSDKIKITISTVKYRTYEGSVTINVYKAGESEPFFISNPIADDQTETIEITDVPEKFQIAIFSTKRCYLSELKIVGSISKPYTNETLVSGVTEMPFTFTPSLAADKYWMQIQAVGEEDLYSDWSDIILVEPDPTSISSAHSAPLHNVFHNVNGQRVDGNYKGIVIKNGKKFFAK